MIRLTPTALALVLTLPLAAEAGLVVSSAGSISIPAGSEGFLDINVRSDSPGGDSLGTVVVSYQIDAPGLSFFADGAGNPDEPQLTKPKYVFFGNSLAVTSGIGGSVNTTRDTYTQSDSTADGTGVTVTSTDVLLATLHFVATTPGEYHITIDPASSAFFDASPNLNSIDFNVNQFDTVTVTAPDSSIPEPPGFILATLGALAVTALHSSVSRHGAR